MPLVGVLSSGRLESSSVVRAIDQFRSNPDTKGPPTCVGVFLTVLAVPTLLSLYFYYIFTTNPTIYATSVIHAGLSLWNGQATCTASGGCFFAGAYATNSCQPYTTDFPAIQLTPYGQSFGFGQTGVQPQYSDASNAGSALSFLMVASVPLSSNYTSTLSSQSLWAIELGLVYMQQGGDAVDPGLTVTYAPASDARYRTAVSGANEDYSIRLVFTLSSLTDSVDSTVQGSTAAPQQVGVTVTSAVQATFASNADIISACLASPTFRASSIQCGPPHQCVTAIATLQPLVTSTTVSKQSTLTALFAQVGGNASNAIVLISVALSAWRALLQWRAGAFGYQRGLAGATVQPLATTILVQTSGDLAGRGGERNEVL